MELNDHDDVVCEFIDRVSAVIDTESVTFLHIAEDLEIPKGIADKYPGLMPSIDESIKGAIEERIEGYEHITAGKNVEIDVVDGFKLQAISKYIRDNDIDMLAINRSDLNDEEVHYLQKLIRRASCSVALVSPTIKENIKTLLVPIDFSKNGFMALETASALCTKHKDMHIHGLHIYKLPHGYFKTGLSKEEFCEELERNAKEQLETYLAHSDLDQSRFTMHYRLQKSDSIAYMINRFSFSKQVDMIVIGSRGGNTLSSFFIGSITESLIDRDQYLPLLVVKDKNENLRLWDALLEL